MHSLLEAVLSVGRELDLEQALHSIVEAAAERVVARNPDRLTDDGLLVLVTDGATPALRSYRLAS
ncbi:hypothetical protein [Streptomyces soliscabiei]|uniref:hypothetical protein n=1 Tax=Streptomyces soliscabiei TaxID=588897 RepID=UPI0029BF0ACA|nr:hypothetical protein [Streptomyces sp. NY05-11A]MDX2681508.1 hypothetical protein [Streptomyces sp. NY05-11A]